MAINKKRSKFTLEQREQAVRQAEELRKIRARFSQALSMGLSQQDAADYAHGRIDLDLSDKPVLLPEGTGLDHHPPSPREQRGDAPVERVRLQKTAEQLQMLTGQGRLVTEANDVPPNWEDLPWPHLKKLAERVSQRAISKRKEAEEAIRDFLKHPNDE